LWPILLAFPFSVIIGNIRHYDYSIALMGFPTYELTFFIIGLGWLVLTLLPKRLVIPVFRIAAVVSAVLVPVFTFMQMGLARFLVYMAFKFFIGLCAACAFYLFCFVLNNVERLISMAFIQIYYGFLYATWNVFSGLHTGTWGGIIAIAIYVVIVFFCRINQQEINTDNDGKGSGVPLVIVLSVIHYMIMCMVNYIEWAQDGLSATAFGAGTLVSVGLVMVIQLLKGNNALYIWLLFLVLSLLGLGVLLYDTPVTFISGSFTYGLGDSLGYIIIYYLCAGAIKQSKSLRMFRLYCLVFFAKYLIISGIFSAYFNYFEMSNKFLAFGIVLVLVSLCLLFLPLIQKRLFNADWTDGIHLKDMEEYSKPFAETEEINVKDKLNLTPREEEIFTMLLSGKAPKDIAFILKISYDTVHFHQKNLYRKLSIQSRAELFARYADRKLV
jgi:DNA-binding CsgD family transcriptional regulator